MEFLYRIVTQLERHTILAISTDNLIEAAQAMGGVFSVGIRID